MERILVTPRSLTKEGDPALSLLTDAGYELVMSSPGKQPEKAELLKLVPHCVGWLAGVETIDGEILKAAGKLKVISRNGTGIDNIDLKAAEALGISVMRAEGANARGVAELTMGLLFALARSIPYCDIRLNSGAWLRRKGIELEGRTLGLVGCGKIGKLVAGMALGMGMKVLAYDAYPDRSFAPGSRFSFADFDTVVSGSDVLSLHCPAQKDGKPIITAEVIGKMKKGAFLINTARASITDEKAVLEGLEQGKLAGFATDVYEKEPPEPSPLQKHERVISTTHIGGFTDESVSRATRIACENILAVLKR